MYFPIIRITQEHDAKPNGSEGFAYASVYRLRTWREWPNGTIFAPIQFTYPTAGVKGCASIRVHGVDTDGAAKTPRYGTIESSRLFVGVPVNKGVDISPPKLGELDIQLTIVAKAPYAAAKILLEAITMAIVARLTVECSEMFQPTGPIVFLTPEHAFDTLFPMPMKVVDPLTITEDNIGPGVMESIGRCLEAMGATRRAEAFSTAVLRYLQAQRQGDAVNSFIDYWLTCVLLAAHVKGKDEARRVARLLVPYLSQTANEEQIFQGLTKPLDRLRNKILHGENFGGLKNPDDAGIAEQLATFLLIVNTGGTCTLDNRVLGRISRDPRKPKRTTRGRG
ncbi:MAG: hypothetical protein U1E63_06025 [Burkholderiales bacterium]